MIRPGAGGVLLALALGNAASASDRAARSDITHRIEQVGQCFDTRVKKVETRLEDDGQAVADSGSAIELADGHYNVAYEQLAGIDKSRPGDRIRLCVTAVPHHCPSGDHRGISYRGKNLRTGLSWRAADAEHMCGGA